MHPTLNYMCVLHYAQPDILLLYISCLMLACHIFGCRPESFGKSTGFLGIYEGSHFLWTRHHCLAKEKERPKQILKRAQAAKFWFHYRSKDVHGDITGTLVQGQNLIDGSEQPFLDEVRICVQILP